MSIRMASDKQKTFIRSLLAERAGNEDAETIRDGLNHARLSRSLTMATASTAIAELLEIMPIHPREVAVDVRFPEGRYALPSEDGHFVFYRVQRVAAGKWAGRVFVSQLLGGAGDWTEQRLYDGAVRLVLDRIAEDPEGAARMFGLKASACGRCGSPLSNTRSRAAGYGETCAAKQGFSYPSEEEARAILDEREAPKRAARGRAESVSEPRPSTCLFSVRTGL